MRSSTPAYAIKIRSTGARAVGRTQILFLLRDRVTALAVIFLLLLVIMAVGASRVTGYVYDDQNLNQVFRNFSTSHWFGTDQYGRDLLTRVLYGARVSLTIGGVAVATEAAIGLSWGTVAGFCGGAIDNLLMRIVDILIAFPTLVSAIFITGIFGPTPLNIIVALSAAAWPGTARIIRSEVVALKEREFVEAARAMGASLSRILVRHLMPNVLALLIVRATLDVSDLILAEATLSFIGIGVQPPRPSWGLLISESFPYLGSHPQLLIVPSVILSLTVVAFNLLGESLADSLNPRGRQHIR
jgi:ABC-type dipeptide/oligopeptide/nickel transport system permease subunit